MKTLLKVETEDDKNYSIVCDEGVTVTEVVYGMAMVARCLLKEGYYDNPIAIEALFHKYLTSEEYNELKEDDEDVTEESN